MAASIGNTCSTNSRDVNGLAMFLSMLALSYLILASTESMAADVSNDYNWSTPEECARKCVANETKTCYYKFVAEMYSAYGGACDLCTPNNTGVINDCECVPVDGVERSVLTVNRRIPGPSIEVCLGDKVIIDVVNNIAGMELTIHWHGLYQKTTPYFDGVPMVTQCPISQGNEFRYQWYAENSGTHFWHAHTGVQELDGIFGPLIIREPETSSNYSDLYDHDLSGHVITVNDWMHVLSIEHFPGTIVRHPEQKPDAVLINGMGRYTDSDSGTVTNTSLAEFIVVPGQRYRFRLITAFATVCWSIFSIEGHSLYVIEVDGEPIKPVRVDTINSFAGERYDFVVVANQTSGSFWIQVRAGGECAEEKVQQLAILRYEGESDDPSSDSPTYTEGLPTGVVLNPTDGICNETREDAVCISQLQRAGWTDAEIFEGVPDLVFYKGFHFYCYNESEVYEPGTYKTFIQSSIPALSLINNFSYADAPAPPLSQYDDIPADQFCYDVPPADCATPCSCTHTIDIPVTDSIVEILLVDQVGFTNLLHPFHMHGHSFYVMAMGHIGDGSEKITMERLREQDEKGVLKRNRNYPVAKDTIAVPTNGYVIIRFRANNPGWWMIHCHFAFHMAIGMDMVIHVGNSTELPPLPEGFPTCGNYLPEPTYGEEWAEPWNWH